MVRPQAALAWATSPQKYFLQASGEVLVLAPPVFISAATVLFGLWVGSLIAGKWSAPQMATGAEPTADATPPRLLPSPSSAVAMLSVIMAAPASHLSGTTFLPGYKMYQPFKGGAWFVFFQGLGWTLYGTAVLHMIVLATQQAHLQVQTNTLGVLGLFATLALTLSFLAFNPHARKPTASVQGGSGASLAGLVSLKLASL